jgi:hypothetical protein
MHIHGTQLNMNPINPYSAAAEKALAAQRAANGRKKPVKKATVTEVASSPEAAFMIGQWMDSRHTPVQSDDPYQAAASGKDPDFG